MAAVTELPLISIYQAFDLLKRDHVCAINLEDSTQQMTGVLPYLKEQFQYHLE